jgi:hypothetical protein
MQDHWIPLDRQLIKSHRWVTELAEHKTSKFPRLKSVELLEGDRFSTFKQRKHPKDLLKAFQASSIRLDIQTKKSFWQT